MNDILNDLYNTIIDRKRDPQEGSYTCYLLDTGLDKILKKIGEESSETIIAAKNNAKDEIVNETCDLIFHLLVMLVDRDIQIEDVYEELAKRAGKTGNLKQFKQVDKNS